MVRRKGRTENERKRKRQQRAGKEREMSQRNGAREERDRYIVSVYRFLHIDRQLGRHIYERTYTPGSLDTFTSTVALGQRPLLGKTTFHPHAF